MKSDESTLGVTKAQLRRLEYQTTIAIVADEIWMRSGGDPAQQSNGRLRVTSIIETITEPEARFPLAKILELTARARGQKGLSRRRA
jgi:hypothetical protein